jgi:hypothetical protein
LLIKKSTFDISRDYKITSPFIINFQSPSILYKGVNFKNTLIQAEYDKDFININKIYADVIDGNVNILGRIELNKKKNIQIKGSFDNISLNRILKQLKISNWERVNIKLSSSNFLFNTINLSSKEFIENLNGHVNINGSVFFVTTEEERFGITFLNLLADKFTNLLSLSKSLSYISETFADTPSDILGKVIIKNGILITKNLSISNKKDNALLSGTLDLNTKSINGKIDLFKNDKIFLTANLKGDIENPELLIDGDIFSDDKYLQPQNIKDVFEKGIKSILDNIINQND